MKVRRYQASDCDQVARLFHDTVHAINRRDYSPAQLEAWAPADIHFIDWQRRCSECQTFVADDDGTVAGFAQLESDGHIDCFYVHKDYQRCGVGRALVYAIAIAAGRLGCRQLFTEASLTAEPFFRSMGFEFIQRQSVSCRGQILVNCRMQRALE